MTNIFQRITSFFDTSFEDMLFAKFRAEKESKSIEVKPLTPLMPPFHSKEVDVYINRDKNLVFVEAFGENSCFLRYLIYSLCLTYKQPNAEGAFKNNFYIFTDNPENIDCPPLFFIIPTRRKDLYQKVSELKEQIMPEPMEIYPYPMHNSEEKSPQTKPPKTSRWRGLPEFIYRLHELVR